MEDLTGQFRDRVDLHRRHVVPLHPVMGRHSCPDHIRHAGNRLVLRTYDTNCNMYKFAKALVTLRCKID